MITVEDFNTVNLQYVNEYYTCNTGNITDSVFSDVLYDFLIVSHIIRNDGKHEFTFIIENSLWHGAYWISNSDGEFIDITATYEDNVLTVVSDSNIICLNLYLTNLTDNFNLVRLESKIEDSLILETSYDCIDEPFTVNVRDLQTNEINNYTPSFNDDCAKLAGVFVVKLPKKIEFKYSIQNNKLVIGKVNTVYFTFNESYDGLIDHMFFYVKYNEELIDIDSSFSFDLDLRDKIDNKDVKFTVIYYGSEYVNGKTEEVSLNVDYPVISSFDDLNSNVAYGVNIVTLNNDIVFTNRFNVEQDLYIRGNGFEIDLNGNGFNIKNGCSLKINDCVLTNGTSAFIQETNSKLIVNNVKSSLNSISDKYKGSVINAVKDTVTEINNSYLDGANLIYHGGNLTVKNTEFNCNSFNDVDNDYACFINAYDGEINLYNNIFDLTVIDNICENNVDIKFAGALFNIAESTVFNTVKGINLMNNDVLPLFDAPFNNVSHVLYNSYYPAIDDCIVINPVIGSESKSATYSIMGMDFVFKSNCKLNRMGDMDINLLNPLKR